MASGKRMIIAVDGPAAAGKGTIARLLATRYSLRHLDTGKIYRYLGLEIADQFGGECTPEVVNRLSANMNDFVLSNPILLTERAGRAAAAISGLQYLRDSVLDYQRRYAHSGDGAVLDGRDIGTVVLPDADVKLFVTATPEARAMRRVSEERQRGHMVSYDAILAGIRDRDERDMHRAAAPLKQAPDASLLDTSALDIEAAFRAAVDIVDKRR